MFLSIKKFQSMHVLFKTFVLFGILGSWGAFLVWISFQTSISLICQGCWENSLLIFFVAFTLYIAACLILFTKWPTRVGVFICGLALFWVLLYALESDMALVGLFLNADPFLYSQEKKLNRGEDWKISDMDTSRIIGIPPEAYMVNIKRWDMVRFLKGQEHRKGRRVQ
jgi:hypothetical protein